MLCFDALSLYCRHSKCKEHSYLGKAKGVTCALEAKNKRSLLTCLQRLSFLLIGTFPVKTFLA